METAATYGEQDIADSGITDGITNGDANGFTVDPTNGYVTKKGMPDWAQPFLTALANSGNVRIACETAKITRRIAYILRKNSRTFDKQWEEAIEDACDLLEKVAWERAQKQSDLLIIFLLKAHRHWLYRETTRHGIGGVEGGTVSIKVVYERKPNGSPSSAI